MRPLRPRGLLRWAFVAAVSFLPFAPALYGQSQVAGTYHCAGLDVNGRSGPCNSPSLTLYADGNYQIWGEQGTYTVQGDRLYLSQSKKRGPGRLQGANEIVFEYIYRRQKYRVTFRRQYTIPAGLALI